MSGVTGGEAGGRDFIPLHYYYPTGISGNSNNNVLLKYTTIEKTTISLEYFNSDGDSLLKTTIPFTVVNDSNISFNWLQEYYVIHDETRDNWGLDDVSISLHHGMYHRMIFQDSFDKKNESEQKWSFVNGSITDTSVCADGSCVFFNEGPINVAARRYAQTYPLDARVITFLDIELAPTNATLHYTTDCTLGQQLM